MSPRPILKRSPSSTSPPHIQPHAVHFPPSPALTRTFSALSSSQYDRSPIVVESNTCALPERGCPGRTYTIEEQQHQQDRNNAMYSSYPPRSHSGRVLHPRALGFAPGAGPTAYPSSSSGSQTMSSQCLGLAMPPLVPDLSSESDESDGFTSPPPSAIYAPSSSRAPLKGYPPTGPSMVYDEYVSFLPHPPAPPLQHSSSSSSHHAPVYHGHSHAVPTEEQRARRRRDRDLKRERSRERDRVREEAEEYDADDATVVSSSPRLSSSPRVSSSSPRSSRRTGSSRSSGSSSSGHASLCRSFSGFSVEDNSSGCLGGF
ncbi:hypothetical protein HGRIS_006660 [Hohenbuehelia grisea]|uniref:Uncharacterized protein n=1 Tax=Hohenbuehelia grisea TaxID=104357 RepID=A0ABR3J9M0_9AGAR